MKRTRSAVMNAAQAKKRFIESPGSPASSLHIPPTTPSSITPKLSTIKAQGEIAFFQSVSECSHHQLFPFSACLTVSSRDPHLSHQHVSLLVFH